MRRGWLGCVWVLAFALPAHAEETFPGKIQQAAGMPCAPTCLLCHTAIPGSIANLKQPFGLAVLGNGILPGRDMNAVVAKLRTNQVDTDKDGKLDVVELAQGTNPNDPDPNAELCGPTYGCGAHVAQAPLPTRTPVLYWLAASLGLAGLIAARRVARRT